MDFLHELPSTHSDPPQMTVRGQSVSVPYSCIVTEMLFNMKTKLQQFEPKIFRAITAKPSIEC
jgi:hypothetical protein